MRKYLALTAIGMLAIPQSLIAQEPAEPAPAPRESKAPVQEPVQEDVASAAEVAPMERGIVLVRLAEIQNEIDLARLAYEKAKNENLRRYASKMEAIHLENRDKLRRLLRAIPVAEVVAAEPEVREKTTIDVTRTVDESGRTATVRRGDGSQDPSFGGKPDAGSRDQYNRNTLNAKPDNEEEKARLQSALREQSTPTVLERRREVDRPVSDSPIVVRAAPQTDEWVVVQQKVSAARLKNARRMLSEMAGAAFEETYLMMQIAGYQATMDADEVYADYLTGENRRFAEEEMESAVEHMREAEALLREVREAAKDAAAF